MTFVTKPATIAGNSMRASAEHGARASCPPHAVARLPRMSSDDAVLRVALPVPLARLFDYRAPERRGRRQAAVGGRVRVPFGPRELIGVVADVGAGRCGARAKRSAALALLDVAPLLHGELLDSLRWLARYAHAPLGEVLATALPAPCARASRCPTPHDLGLAADRRRVARRAQARRRRRVGWRRCCAAGALRKTRSTTPLPGWRAAARALRETRPGRSDPDRCPRASPARRTPGPALNDEQRAAVEAIVAHRRLRRGAARRRHRQRQDRGLPAGDRRLPGARATGAGARAGDRADAADARALPRAPRRAGACAAFGPERHRARPRVDRRRARRGARDRRHALGGVHAAAAKRA